MKNLKTEIKWSLIFAGVTLLWMLLERVTGLHDRYIDKHEIYTNFYAIPAILIYVFALLEKRRDFYNGIISYKQAFISGLFLTLFIAILNPVVQIITSELITPDFFGNMADYVVSTGKMSRDEALKYFSLKSYIIQSVIGAIIMGIITTSVVSIFIRKNPKTVYSE